MRHPIQKAAAFTLVELLVVIGIIAVLIGILLPTLTSARKQAYRVQDLSNIRQMALAVFNYAANNKGAYPVGTKGYGGEDMAWVNNDLADMLTQFTTSNAFNFSTAQPASGTTYDHGRVKMLCCNSIYDMPNETGGQTGILSPVYYYANEEQLGWIYWANRQYTTYASYASPATATLFSAPIQNRDGTASTNNYVFASHAGQKATSRTLFTCPAFLSPSSYNGLIPHYYKGAYSGGVTASAASPYAFVNQMSGLTVAYTDGSARFAAPGDLGAVTGGFSYYFYDKTAN